MPRRETQTRRLGRARQPPWARWPDRRLLELRFCDLALRLDGAFLGPRIAQLHRELEQAGIVFRPFFWFSTEWFTPDGVPGVAIPFYLGHPRLMRLEASQIIDVEGGTPEWCMKILRHETGHAIDNAHRLRRRQGRAALFGRSSQTYPKFYTPRPHSKRYVVHLEPWYAQSHPDEDFAETFAVWLDPRSQWRKRYSGWPALKKLEYMDGLIREVGPLEPAITTRRRVDALPRLRKTLARHYAEKRERYGLDYPSVPDRDLRRLFSDAPEHRGNVTAARFLGRIRDDVRRIVAHWTREYQYTIDQVVNDMITRCRELRLRLATPPEQARTDVAVLLTVLTMNALHSGEHRIWL